MPDTYETYSPTIKLRHPIFNITRPTEGQNINLNETIDVEWTTEYWVGYVPDAEDGIVLIANEPGIAQQSETIGSNVDPVSGLPLSWDIDVDTSGFQGLPVGGENHSLTLTPYNYPYFWDIQTFHIQRNEFGLRITSGSAGDEIILNPHQLCTRVSHTEVLERGTTKTVNVPGFDETKGTVVLNKIEPIFSALSLSGGEETNMNWMNGVPHKVSISGENITFTARPYGDTGQSQCRTMVTVLMYK